MRKIFDKNKYKKSRKAEEGSALIMTVIALASALVIVISVSVVSISEKELTGKIRNSAAAFQAADSGMEYILKRKEDGSINSGTNLDDLCGRRIDNLGACDPEIYVFGEKLNIKIYFLGKDGILSSGTAGEVGVIRSVGTAGKGKDSASRTLEVVVYID